MIKRELIDKTVVPGGGELRLVRRGAEFSILLGHEELMNSRRGGSERRLAELALNAIGPRPRPALLIGGLGMGFTLRAALERSPADASILVSEIVPAVIAWARGPMAGIFGDSLSDSRLTVSERDVARVICESRSHFDAILLDVDNGPSGLSLASNDRLYNDEGLAAARAALVSDGVLAIWSAGPDAGFVARMRKAGFDVDQFQAGSNPSGGGARHLIWLARSRGVGPHRAR